MIPITRKENYLNEIVGWGETAPEKPLTPEEFFFAAILGEAVQTPEPLSRYQIYLAKIAGRNISVPKPLTRLELFLAKACGMDIETPTPITREEIFWSNYSAIADFEVEGVPPLTYQAIEGTLENYRIYGNTVDGESVGDRTGNLFDKTRNTIPDAILDDGAIYPVGGVGGYLIYAPITPLQTYTFCTNGTIRLGLRSAFTIDKPALSVSYVIDNVNTHYNHGTDNEFTRQAPLKANWIVIQIRNESALAYDNMLNLGSTVLPYEPYGYKVPVTISNGTDTQTIPIYLPEQIRKVGDEEEYIEYGEQKQHRIGADDIDVTLPALPTLTGTTVLSVGTAVQPSKVYVKYKGERQ